MWNLNLALIKWFLLFWVSHRVLIVSQAPLINIKVQGERLFKCHHLDQSSWVTNQKQSFCFMGFCENQFSEHVNPFSHSLKMWVVLHPKYTGQSHFPLCLWTCSKNPMSVSVYFSDKFCHVFDWNVENSNKFSNFCGKISPNFEYQRIETNNPGQRVILLVKKSLMSSEVNTTVEYGYCEEHLSLSLSLSHTQRNCCRQNDGLLCNDTSLRTGL
jgi:hypothetical protein